jgi:mono/diheme cytochrome c family protein
LRLILIITAALLAALLLTSCRHQEQSVMSDQAQAQPKPPASAVPAVPPPGPQAAPSVVPAAGQPVGPSGQNPGVPPPGGRRGPSITSFPMTTSQAKPTPSPAPTLKPRPVPAPVVVNGKIVQQWQAPPEAAKLANPVKDKPDAAKIGRSFYMQKCNACHGDEGRGNGWMSPSVGKPPTDLTSAMVQANTDGELFWKVTNGRSPMPAHKVRFDDEQRWYIVTFLRTLK